MQRLWLEQAYLSDGWASGVHLTIDGNGVIDSITRNAPRPVGVPCHGIALPGLPNLHSHAFQRGMAGLTEYRTSQNDDFWSWRALMYRFLDRLEADDVEAIAAFAYMEMLECGFTRVGEFHYLHHDTKGAPYANPAEMAEKIAAASGKSGIGLTLLPVFYQYAGFDRRPPQPQHRRFVTTFDGYARLLEASRKAIAPLTGATIGVAPHSLRAVDSALIKDVADLGGGGPIHIHAAEQVKEVEECQHALGQRPVEWLLTKAGVDKRWCLVHATHLSEAETKRLAASGAVAGLCPITEANLGDGLFPAADYLAQGGAFGVGSDSNILISAVEELRTLEYGQRLRLKKRNVLAGTSSTGAHLFTRTLEGGAQALGQSAPGLKAGCAADIVTLDAKAPCFTARNRDALFDAWIFTANRPVVDCVWRRGRKYVESGRHIARDEITMRYRNALCNLLSI